MHQEAIEVGDGQQADAPLGGVVLQAPRHLAQGVDVETRVNFVEDADRGPNHPQLDHFGALALATGEVDVEGSAQQAGIETYGLRLLFHSLLQRGGRLRANLAHTAPHSRSSQQRVQAHPGDLHRVLQRQEQPGAGRPRPAVRPAPVRPW